MHRPEKNCPNLDPQAGTKIGQKPERQRRKDGDAKGAPGKAQPGGKGKKTGSENCPGTSVA